MKVGTVEIDDTFAEAFSCTYSRILITASNEKWAKIAAQEVTGFGTSMIACSAEGGIEGYVPPEETPDGRPGYVVQFWIQKKAMLKELIARIGQCILPTPTTAVWNYTDSEETLDVGHKMRFFGDGHESALKAHDRELVSIPLMLGDFLIEKEIGIARGVAGGNFIILADSQEAALEAAEKAVSVIEEVKGAITPFPGGICASGSKVGSKKYSFMCATTNECYCPTIAHTVEISKVKDVAGVSEIVIDGINESTVRKAMKLGIEAAASVSGVKRITAGNYGGDLGDTHIKLRELF